MSNMSYAKCPSCGSSNVFYNYRTETYKCHECGHTWGREAEKPTVPPSTEPKLITCARCGARIEIYVKVLPDGKRHITFHHLDAEEPTIDGVFI